MPFFRSAQPFRATAIAVACALAACSSPPPAAPGTSASPAAPEAAARPAGPAAGPATVASATPARPADFTQWLAAFRASALAAGITEDTLGRTLDKVQFLPRVVESDQAQPEFTRTVWDYLDSAVSPQRVARGRDKLLEVQVAAQAASARYGVPAETVVAIWGMESNYGQNYGDIPTLDALATLGFEGRREAWAKDQLLAALKIVQSGDIDAAHMLGSWAGAMGQTQFLPTNFLAYAVDGDGDGRRDIWGSMADVLASTAHFLARSGWQTGQPWGTEVRLPPDFDLTRADDRLRQSAGQWMAEGLRGMDGGLLPLTLGDASVLLPAGARGPAFLVGPNFRTVLRYNNSTSYALAVSLLAQALAGGPGVQAAWPRDLQALTRSQVLALQNALGARGFDSGKPDGLLGPATRDAIRAYQRSIGLPPDGYPDPALLQRLQMP